MPGPGPGERTSSNGNRCITLFGYEINLTHIHTFYCLVPFLAWLRWLAWLAGQGEWRKALSSGAPAAYSTHSIRHAAYLNLAGLYTQGMLKHSPFYRFYLSCTLQEALRPPRLSSSIALYYIKLLLLYYYLLLRVLLYIHIFDL